MNLIYHILSVGHKAFKTGIYTNFVENVYNYCGIFFIYIDKCNECVAKM